MTDGLLCGWRIVSELPLPELVAWEGEDRPADLTVRLGAVDDLPGMREISPLLHIGEDGCIRLDVPALARFRVDPTGEIVIAPEPAADEADLRLFLLGSVLGIVCHQRALLPLHASSVEIDGGAVAFCGASGMGKSTLALHFTRRGHALVADDVCVVEGGSPARVRPAFPRLKLWRDALEGVDLSTEGLERNRRRLDKFHLPAPHSAARHTLPLKAIFLLRRPEYGGEERIERLAGPLDILAELETETYRPQVGRALGRDATLFRLRALVAGGTPVYRLMRQREAPPERWLDAIVATVRG
ncbi:HPr kinase/phosphorylase [Ancylobacter sp. IITR112]|uniref:HPr kinase/phosphorylase n=1 Tax=Ancylobacter sp. IITR112 TaxID=3138073 RepID=UPI00352B5DC7